MATKANDDKETTQSFQIINETDSIMRGSGSYGDQRLTEETCLESDDSGRAKKTAVEYKAENGHSKTGKKTRGRVKIDMKYIENKLRRYTTFSKRKTGIMKKAYELSTLTGTQVMLLVASETGHVYTFATRKLQPMITSETGKALIQTCLNSPDNSQQGHEHSRSEDGGTPAAAFSQTVGLQENFSQHPPYPWCRPESSPSSRTTPGPLSDEDLENDAESQTNSSQKNIPSANIVGYGTPVYPVAQVQQTDQHSPSESRKIPSKRKKTSQPSSESTVSSTGIESIVNGLAYSQALSKAVLDSNPLVLVPGTGLAANPGHRSVGNDKNLVAQPMPVAIANMALLPGHSQLVSTMSTTQITSSKKDVT